MKKYLLSIGRTLMLFAFIGLATYSLESCGKKDPCGDSCVNGYCADGDCVCSTGYTGKWCATYTGGSSSSGSSSSGSSSSGSSSSGSSSSGSSSSGSSSSGSSSSGSSSSGPTDYTATFWSNFSGTPISVYIGGSYAGQITQYYTTSPACGATGCVTKTYSGPTSISYTAEDDTHNWDGTLSIAAGCNKMCLTQ